MTVRPQRVLFVHAHPDDETLITGGTIARYLRDGAEVRVVTCTLGEEGEVIGQEYAQLCADAADQLGGYRILELTQALAALSGNRPAITPRFLGGAGRFRDSGMADMPSSQNPRAFVNADLSLAAEELAALITDYQPHVVTTYDPDGTYGHPDHMRVHAVTNAAVVRAQELGWDVPKLYWAVAGRAYAQAAARALKGVPEGWVHAPADGLGRFPDEQITTRIDVSSVLAAKRAALRAHATQVTLAANGMAFALSNKIAQPVLAEEHFVLVRTGAGCKGTLLDGVVDETDLFAGL